MKRSFTLIELLAVIIILGIIALVLAPITLSIIDRSKQKMYDNQEQEIIGAATMYVSDNSTIIAGLSEIGTENEITLQELSDLGYINLPIKNYLTGDDFDPDCYLITITKGTDTYYDYDINITGGC